MLLMAYFRWNNNKHSKIQGFSLKYVGVIHEWTTAHCYYLRSVPSYNIRY